MLRSAKELVGYAIGAIDGSIGHVTDLYFDDETWVIRYLIVDTGSWLSSRKVLISPMAIDRSRLAGEQPGWMEKVLPVSITKEQVRNCPDIDTDKPVTRPDEIRHLGYYGYPFYWGAAGLWGQGIYPDAMLMAIGRDSAPAELARPHSEAIDVRTEAADHQGGDSHLRSCKAVTRYHVEASDGSIGHVQGFLVDEETWAIRYLIVDTNNWWLDHPVIVAPRWIQAVRWSDNTIRIDLTQQAVKDSPPYNSAVELDRGLEMAIHRHYGQVGYWVDEAKNESTVPHR